MEGLAAPVRTERINLSLSFLCVVTLMAVSASIGFSQVGDFTTRFDLMICEQIH
jgi:hypothetical protein